MALRTRMNRLGIEADSLPAGYQLCEYLEWSGLKSQAIDLAYEPSTMFGLTIAINMSCSADMTSTQNMVLGNNLSSYQSIGMRATLNTLTFCGGVDDSAYWLSVGNTYGTALMNIVMSCGEGIDTGTVSINGEHLGMIPRCWDSPIGNSLRIGQSDQKGIPADCFRGRIYSPFKIESTRDDYQFNGICALDPNGIPCLYDTLSKTPFYASTPTALLFKLQ